MYVRLLSVIAFVAIGCSAAQLDTVDPVTVKDPPCDEQNPYRCNDGSCCDSARPVCWGPDAVGFYCEAQETDPMDPDVFGARPKHYARRPGVQ